MEAVQKEGYELKKIIESPQVVARIFSPVLTAEERAKRMKAIHKAAERILKAVM